MRKFIAAAVMAATSGAASAAPIDLSSWSALTLDFAGGQPAGNWDLSPDNTEVTQTVNADPSFYLNNLNQTQYTIGGSWQVKTASDDDYMGFVFGYQNSSNFYLFDWKGGTQSYAGATANEGMSVKKFEGATGDGLADLSLGEFWNNDAPTFDDMSVLATNHGGDKGWAANVIYDFELVFNEIADQFTVRVSQGATELWNTTIADSTFTSGQFGFYNYSQQQVSYAGFEQEGGVIVDVPEPGTFVLTALGLLGLSARLRKA